MVGAEGMQPDPEAAAAIRREHWNFYGLCVQLGGWRYQANPLKWRL